MKLIVTEKPSVGRSIATALGIKEKKDGYIEGLNAIVTWCIGHLVDLAPAELYDVRYAKWHMEDLPIIPETWKYIINDSTKAQFETVKALMNCSEVDTVVCATDAGREGELIFRLVYNQAGCTKPIQRLWIASMEESAIQEGFRSLRAGNKYDSLYHAALCRNQADWLVGINASRLYSLLYDTTLNVGRVMSPTLALMFMSEQTIEAGLSPGTGMQLAPEAAAQPTAKERLKEITAGIEKGIKDLFASDQYAMYLKTMSKFHNYSLNNIMLIYMQKPDASLVAGFNRWRDQFQRHVLKGEKGIKIIAPAPYKKKLEREKRDPKTNLVMRDENNNPIKEEYEITIPMFRVTSVFDVSQTDGKPLPTLSHDLTGTVEHYDAFYEAVLRSSPVPIEMEQMASGQGDGYFDLSKQRIAIREGMSEPQTILAAIHEITHATLHNYDMKAAQENPDPNKPPKDRRTMEVEGESVSYSVCAYYGIETGDNSFGYIGNWSKNKELPVLKASLETINNMASAIISNIDRNLQEIMQERGLQPPMVEYPGTERDAFVPQAQYSVSILPIGRLTPDPTATMKELRDYGYGDNDLLPLNKAKAMELFDQNVPVYTIYQDGSAVMVGDTKDIEMHSGFLGVEPADWRSSPDFKDKLAKHDMEADRLEQAFLTQTDTPAIAIYQLRDLPELASYRFMSTKALETAGLEIDRKHYDPIYTMPYSKLGQDTEQALGSIFEMFNLARPDDFRGHSLSTSDIVAIKQDGEVSFHYVDSIGFKPLDHFLEPENPLKNAEMAMEDDANMIDGIINNGPKQETKEPPSILAQLEKPLPREPKAPDRAVPKKDKGMEL